jgi:hypothetical protein
MLDEWGNVDPIRRQRLWEALMVCCIHNTLLIYIYLLVCLFFPSFFLFLFFVFFLIFLEFNVPNFILCKQSSTSRLDLIPMKLRRKSSRTSTKRYGLGDAKKKKKNLKFNQAKRLRGTSQSRGCAFHRVGPRRCDGVIGQMVWRGVVSAWVIIEYLYYYFCTFPNLMLLCISYN